MALLITHVRFSTTSKTHETITHYKWTSLQDHSASSTSKSLMVDWIDKGGEAVVGSGAAQVHVAVVRPAAGQPYLRTHADGKFNNNLLSLPTF